MRISGSNSAAGSRKESTLPDSIDRPPSVRQASCLNDSRTNGTLDCRMDRATACRARGQWLERLEDERNVDKLPRPVRPRLPGRGQRRQHVALAKAMMQDQWLPTLQRGDRCHTVATLSIIAI